MGGSQSSFMPEGDGKQSLKQGRPRDRSSDVHYTSKQHHTQYHGPEQKQQQLYTPQQLQHQQQHHNISDLSTTELLDYLERELSSTVETIQNMRKEKIFDDGGRSYICDVMVEKENLLRKFNNSMQKRGDNREKESSKELQHQLYINARDIEEERTTRAGVSYIDHMKQQLEKVKTEKDVLLTRLSKMAGDKLVRDNPDIADLSDRNRPTKIGEMYSEIYDNEWTEAFEALSNTGYSEEDAIETLRLTLLNVYQFCSRKAGSLLTKTEEAVSILFEEYKETEQNKVKRHLTMPRNSPNQWDKLAKRQSFTDDLETIALQDKWKPNIEGNESLKRNKSIIKTDKSEVAVADQLKKFRKDVAESMVPIVEKAYMSASWNEKCVYAIKPFIKRCIFLGWMMVVQSPPMAFAESKPGDSFEKEVYKEYTQRGNVTDYVVWPALLLNRGGPIVGKGVIQAKKL